MASTITRLLVGGLAVATLSACGGTDSGGGSTSAASGPTTAPTSQTPTSAAPTSGASPSSETPSSETPSSEAPSSEAPTSAGPTSGSPTSGEPSPSTATGAPATDCSPTAVKGAPGLTLAQAKLLVGKTTKECIVYKQGTPGFMASVLTAAVTSRPGWAEAAATDTPAPRGATQRTDPRSFVLLGGVWHEYRVWEGGAGTTPTVTATVS